MLDSDHGHKKLNVVTMEMLHWMSGVSWFIKAL
jgi:hypothetical protein